MADEPGNVSPVEADELPEHDPANWTVPPGEVRTLAELRERAERRMTTEHQRDPALDADVSKLERRQTISYVLLSLACASVGASAALIYSEEEPDLPSAYAGIILGTISFGTAISSLALMPSRKKMREVAEEHGLAAPTVSARFGQEKAMVTLRFRWGG